MSWTGSRAKRLVDTSGATHFRVTDDADSRILEGYADWLIDDALAAGATASVTTPVLTFRFSPVAAGATAGVTTPESKYTGWTEPRAKRLVDTSGGTHFRVTDDGDNRILEGYVNWQIGDAPAAGASAGATAPDFRFLFDPASAGATAAVATPDFRETGWAEPRSKRLVDTSGATHFRVTDDGSSRILEGYADWLMAASAAGATAGVTAPQFKILFQPTSAGATAGVTAPQFKILFQPTSAIATAGVTENQLRPLPPSPPENLVVTRAGDFLSATLTWDAVGGATGYEIVRALEYRGQGSVIDTEPTLSYVDSPLTASQSYTYSVRAVNTVMNINGLRTLPAYVAGEHETLTA